MKRFNLSLVKKAIGIFILILLIQTFFALFVINFKNKEQFGPSHILVLFNYLALMLVYIYFKTVKGRSNYLIYFCILVFVALFSYFIYNKIGY